jgi:hypothetical protein
MVYRHRHNIIYLYVLKMTVLRYAFQSPSDETLIIDNLCSYPHVYKNVSMSALLK